MEKYEEMKKDRETKKERPELKISLTDKQYIRLSLKAYRAGLESPEELIESFVGDLTGWQSNGSDEEMLTESWYDRAFFLEMQGKAFFRYYLFNNDYGKTEIEGMLESEDYFKAVYQDYIAENEGLICETEEQCFDIIIRYCSYMLIK